MFTRINRLKSERPIYVTLTVYRRRFFFRNVFLPCSQMGTPAELRLIQIFTSRATYPDSWQSAPDSTRTSTHSNGIKRSKQVVFFFCQHDSAIQKLHHIILCIFHAAIMEQSMKEERMNKNL